MSRFLDQLSLLIFVAMLSIASLFYGVWSVYENQFPAPQIAQARTIFHEWMSERDRHEMISFARKGPLTTTYDAETVAPGLIAVSGMTEGPKNFIRVIDREGKIVHELTPNWFDIWGDGGDFPMDRRPRSKPGTLIHGFAFLDDGSVVFNFEYLSTVRMSPCGDVIWKLDNLGHHNVHIDDQGWLWIPAEKYYQDDDPEFPGHRAPLRSWTIQKISQQGRVAEEIEIIDVLLRSDQLGLLYLSSLEKDPRVSGDTLHLNDVDIFPADLDSSVFSPGDIMLSLRNINTILVLDRETRHVKFKSTGDFLRHHDPDFLSGDRILVYDNRNVAPGHDPSGRESRLLEIDARSGDVVNIELSGPGVRFFTHVMGKQQPLGNGNILISTAKNGRAIEVDASGELVWEYNNIVEERYNGLVSQAELLPVFMDREFFEKLSANCSEEGA